MRPGVKKTRPGTLHASLFSHALPKPVALPTRTRIVRVIAVTVIQTTCKFELHLRAHVLPEVHD
jgi:hypothetical protein